MGKLLIADHSKSRSTNLSNALRDDWEIHVAVDGYAAIDTMKYLDPDAMIINLNLEKKDGLTVLEECFPNVPPVTLAISTYISPYVAQTAASLGVGYILPIPCTAKAVKERLDDMQQAYIAKPDRVIRHLHTLGISLRQDGYRFLIEAISAFSKDRNMRLQKELYNLVADVCDACNAQCVEKSIRVAIRYAWERRDPAVWDYYFPGVRECPTNGEFIARISELI